MSRVAMLLGRSLRDVVILLSQAIVLIVHRHPVRAHDRARRGRRDARPARPHRARPGADLVRAGPVAQERGRLRAVPQHAHLPAAAAVGDPAADVAGPGLAADGGQRQPASTTRSRRPGPCSTASGATRRSRSAWRSWRSSPASPSGSARARSAGPSRNCARARLVAGPVASAAGPAVRFPAAGAPTIRAMTERPIKVLIAKPGLDGHDRGAKVLARGLRDEGFEVVYTGLRQTPEMIATAALQEDVDVVGLSILSGAHMTLLPRICAPAHGRRAMDDVLVTAGGIIPDDDVPALREAGVAAVFGPGHDDRRRSPTTCGPTSGRADSVPAVPTAPGGRAAATRGAELARAAVAGDRLALARLLTAVENRTPVAEAALRRLYPLAGRAHLVGITGPPGAGKSHARRRADRARSGAAGRPVAVLAVDPSSPITGGALLGDRVRMQAYAGDRDVFIRSMASRGHAGGLASTTSAAAAVLDAAASTSSSSRRSAPARARSRSPPPPTRRSCSRRPRWATRSRRSRPACSRSPTSSSSTRATGRAPAGRPASCGRCWRPRRRATADGDDRPRPEATRGPRHDRLDRGRRPGAARAHRSPPPAWPAAPGRRGPGSPAPRPRSGRSSPTGCAARSTTARHGAPTARDPRPRSPTIALDPYAAADRLLDARRGGRSRVTIERVFVAGAGLMGHGIAQVHGRVGSAVDLYEPELARAEAGPARIAGNLERAVAKGRLTRRGARRDARPGRRRPIGWRRRPGRPRRRGRLRGRRRQDAALGASSTRSPRRRRSSPRTRARSRSTGWPRRSAPDRRARFVGMHFFSPVPVMPLIELIRGHGHGRRDGDRRSATSPARLGKQVIVSADRPGFIVNRILMPFLAEAMRALEEGVGTAEDIDTGARVGLNHPMGPLELADFIGLDVCLGIMRVLHEGLGDEQFRPPQVLEELVAAGHLGQKTGRASTATAEPARRSGRSDGPAPAVRAARRRPRPSSRRRWPGGSRSRTASRAGARRVPRRTARSSGLSTSPLMSTNRRASSGRSRGDALVDVACRSCPGIRWSQRIASNVALLDQARAPRAALRRRRRRPHG